MSNKSGFTLAEIIITLTIIGVVAAISIPNMMQNIQDMHFHTAWKQTYSVFEQATRLIMSENSGSLNGISTSSLSLKEAYRKKLLYMKSCTNGDIEGCWHQVPNYYFYNGTQSDMGLYAPALILNNGNLVWFYCAAQYDCMIGVDVNGFKKPNRYGKDIYIMNANAVGIKPAGNGKTFDTNNGTDAAAYFLLH